MNDFLSIVKNLQTERRPTTDNLLSACVQNFIDTQNLEGLQECLKLGVLQPRFADEVCCETTAQSMLCQNWSDGWTVLCQTAVEHTDFTIEPLMLTARTNPKEAQTLIDAVFASVHTRTPENLQHIAHLAIFQNDHALYAKCCECINKEDGELAFPYDVQSRIKTAITYKRIWPLENLCVESKKPEYYINAIARMVGHFPLNALLEFEKTAQNLFSTPEVESALLENIYSASSTWNRDVWEWAQTKLKSMDVQTKEKECLQERYWTVTESLYSRGEITQDEAFRVLDETWSTNNNIEMLELLFEETVKRYGVNGQIQTLRHLSEYFPAQYTHCFMQMENSYPFTEGCDKILHQINDNTDALIAQSQVNTPLINEWRQAWKQKQALQESIGHGGAPIRKKM